ncbi:hypothetical protein GWC95_03665 [Sediminibacterium roseum]|uniref:Uncharacterized protein n=1 Tax=Sediminibacterium roseum TaxID=1978412 RepID=A0ABW9ZPI5_9BACT|nr:hypothetical protein [Sediminibacterium roseum]NCI49004.1 hypothetical protein [Sediminibacterium roseum]
MNPIAKYAGLFLIATVWAMTGCTNGTDTNTIRSVKTAGAKSASITYVSPASNNWRYDSLRSMTSTVPANGKRTFPFGGWVSVEQYKGKRYIYYPCDLAYLSRTEITPVVWKEYGFETEESRIRSVSYRGKNQVEYDLTDPAGRLHKVTLYLVDANNGLVVKETNSGSAVYNLLVSTDRLHTLPMIVNECDSKVEEVEMDKIDFVRLLRGAGFKK